MERDFSEEEAVDALKVLRGDRASGLKSMMMAFISEFWDVVKPEVMGMMQYFSSVSVCLSLFISLIPLGSGECDHRVFTLGRP